MDHNRVASYIRVFPGDALTAGHQAEAIRRLADALGMTIVREYEDEEYGSGPGGRPQFHRVMDEAGSEPGPFGAVTSYGRWPFAPCAADLTKYVRSSRTPGSNCSARGTSRQGTPQGYRTRRSGGGGRPEGPGDRRRLTLLQHMAANPAQIQG